MKEELDNKLVQDFPLLYRDRYGDMSSTCMVWGFPGDGWEPLIRELSGKLEKMIKEFYEKNQFITDCSCCGDERKDHYGYLSYNPGKCLAIHKVAKIQHPRWLSWPHRFSESAAKRFLKKMFSRLTLKITNLVGFVWFKRQTCWCDKYDPAIPRASQVKEKFGTLRFYMSSHLDGMDELIDEAERKSEVTCENCGKSGESRGDLGWVLTLCDGCHRSHKKSQKWKTKT